MAKDQATVWNGGVTYREIVVRIPATESDVYVALLEKQGDALGISLEEYCATVLIREGQRLWYIERSKPKPQSSAPKTPVGRPRIDPAEHQRRELAAFLEAIYIKLRGMLGVADFDMVHGKDYEQLGKLLIAKDLEGLQAFSREQPWQKIRSGR